MMYAILRTYGAKGEYFDRRIEVSEKYDFALGVYAPENEDHLGLTLGSNQTVIPYDDKVLHVDKPSGLLLRDLCSHIEEPHIFNLPVKFKHDSGITPIGISTHGGVLMLVGVVGRTAPQYSTAQVLHHLCGKANLKYAYDHSIHVNTSADRQPEILTGIEIYEDHILLVTDKVDVTTEPLWLYPVPPSSLQEYALVSSTCASLAEFREAMYKATAKQVYDFRHLISVCERLHQACIEYGGGLPDARVWREMLYLLSEGEYSFSEDDLLPLFRAARNNVRNNKGEYHDEAE